MDTQNPAIERLLVVLGLAGHLAGCATSLAVAILLCPLEAGAFQEMTSWTDGKPPANP